MKKDYIKNMNPNEEIRILKERVELLENFVADFVYSDRYIFQKNIQIQNGRYVQFALGEGSKIGTTTSQKFAFWGKTPIVQPAHANQAVLNLDLDVTGGDTVDKSAINTNFTSIQNQYNQIRSDLISVGIIKGSS